MEYAKARQLALRRAYPDSFADDDFDFESGNIRIPRPMSAPGSPRFVSGLMTPGDIGTLTEEMQGLGTSDYVSLRRLALVGCRTLTFASVLLSLSVST